MNNEKFERSRLALRRGGRRLPTGAQGRASEGVPSGARPRQIRLRHVSRGHGQGDGGAAASSPERVRDAGMI